MECGSDGVWCEGEGSEGSIVGGRRGGGVEFPKTYKHIHAIAIIPWWLSEVST